MHISRRELIKQESIKNLLSAQKRIAEHGSAIQLIYLTKYLLRLNEKLDDQIIEFGSTNDK